MNGTPQAEPIVELIAVRKSFHFGIATPWQRSRARVRAVDGVSLQIRRNEVVCLVGESGCGKSTTGRMILGLEQPDSGSVLFHGLSVSKLRGAAYRRYRASVQAVFQDPWSSLNPRMRVGESVAEPLVVARTHARRAIKERVLELLSAVGLKSDDVDRYPHEFSGGQRQRIVIARALMIEPELIVLDEPVSSLDVSIRAQILNLLKDLKARTGVSYLLIAHDMAAVRYLGDRVITMYLGRIVEISPSDRLATGPLHPYSKSLVAASKLTFADDDSDAKGDVPSPVNPPSGCPFHPRCALHEQLGRPEICRTLEPQLRSFGSGQSAACHFIEIAEDTPETAAKSASSISA